MLIYLSLVCQSKSNDPEVALEFRDRHFIITKVFAPLMELVGEKFFLHRHPSFIPPSSLLSPHFSNSEPHVMYKKVHSSTNEERTGCLYVTNHKVFLLTAANDGEFTERVFASNDFIKCLFAFAVQVNRAVRHVFTCLTFRW